MEFRVRIAANCCSGLKHGLSLHYPEIITYCGQVQLLYWVNEQTEHSGYWGSGTFVEVTSVTQAAPSVYIPNPSCGVNSNQDEISLVCLVKDFQPKDITQTWSRNNQVITTGIEKFPPVQGKDMKYTMSSVLKVSASDWNTDSVYQCKAGHDSNATVERQYRTPKSPNVIPLIPTAQSIYNQTTAVLGCVISGFAPDGIQVSWKKGQLEQIGVLLPSKQRADDTFATVSYLTVTVVDWKNGDGYVCQVTHAPSNFNQGVSFRYQQESPPDVTGEEGKEEIGYLEGDDNALAVAAFIILFILSFLYSTFVTVVKVQSQ